MDDGNAWDRDRSRLNAKRKPSLEFVHEFDAIKFTLDWPAINGRGILFCGVYIIPKQ